MKHLETKQIIRELAKKHGVNVGQVEDIIGNIPEFIIQTTREEVDRLEGHYPVFRIPGWGTFYVNEWTSARVKNRLQNRLENGDISV